MVVEFIRETSHGAHQRYSYNYLYTGFYGQRTLVFPHSKSFFWRWIHSYLSALKQGLITKIKDGKSTLLWHDRWHEGKTPKGI